MKNHLRSFALAALSVVSVWMFAACDSSTDGVLDPCAGVTECDVVDQKICMNETQYRTCHSNDDGCLVWDCST